MRWRRLPIEIESPEQTGYENIACNLTESSVPDGVLGDLGVDLRALVLAYGDHRGGRALRAAIGGEHLAPEHVLVTAGAAMALYLVATALLAPGDRALIAHTNYATNLETPRALGARVETVPLSFEQGFELDVDALIARITPGTRLVSLTVPHNPTGAMVSFGSLRRVADAVASVGGWLLVDETYRELAWDGPLPPASTLSPRVIGVSSLSKAWGLPGIRVGWLTCRDPELMETLLAAKEQILICTSAVDEAVALAALRRREELLPAILADARRKLALTTEWFAAQRALEWVPPRGGVVAFPRFRDDFPVDLDRFYDVLRDAHGTHVGPGHWFDASRRSFRLGWAWPAVDELSRGLRGISAAAEAARS